MPALLMVNREVRVVPVNWAHPMERTDNLIRPWKPQPIYNVDMPSVEGHKRTWIMGYETTSEGTPFTPPFENTPEGRAALIEFCTEYCFTFGSYTATKEEWIRLLFDEDVFAVDVKTGQLV